MANAPAYQPRWTKGYPGGSDILDRNLREIALAFQGAFGTIEDLRTTIVNILSGDTVININFPGLTARQGIQGIDGDDGMEGMPGRPGAPGAPGARGMAGTDGQDGDDGLGFLPISETSGMPLGTLPSEYTATGDVATTLNGDSRIRSNYSRVCVGPYVINDPAVLVIEDNAVLGVF